MAKRSTLPIREFGRMLVEAGVITEERLNNITRIVIDCDAMIGTVTVYTQEIPNGEAMAKLAPMLKGMIPDGSE